MTGSPLYICSCEKYFITLIKTTSTMKKFRYLLLIYITLFIGTRIVIFKSNDVESGSISLSDSINDCIEIYQNSDLMDMRRVEVEGEVIQCGHILFNLLFIDTYLLETSNGCKLRVFCKTNIPTPGRYLEVTTTFRQFYNVEHIHYFGLIEEKRVPVLPKEERVNAITGY
jgi:hypothetical protein